MHDARARRAAQRAGYAVLAAGGRDRAACCSPRRLPRRARTPAAVAVALGAFALALLAGGVADEQLLPARWGELAAGIGRGLVRAPRRARALPRARTSGRGSCSALGGTVLAVLAALAAFWPRRRELGLRNVALVLLVTLYAVPAVALDLSSEFLSRRAAGAARRRLPAARAAADHRRRRGRRCSPSGSTILGLAAAPALDTDQPVVRLRDLGAVQRLARSRPTFTWDHSYGPLDWPRDGRELLRVKAKRPAYWKAHQPRHLRRRAAGCATAARPTSTAATSPPTSTTARAGCRRSAVTCATCARRRS